MLRSVLVDIARAFFTSKRTSTAALHEEDATRRRQVGATPASLHFAQRILALRNIPITPDASNRILAECTSIEQDNRYIPSAFKAILEYKRYQVEIARGDREGAVKSLRNAIALAPYDDGLLAVYKTALERSSPTRNIALIVSCKKYEAKALSLARQFRDAHIDYAIVSGEDSAPIEDPHAIRVSAPDNYEGLPRKVAAAFTWVCENLGADVGVLKVDDDQNLVDPGKLTNIIDELRRLDVYAGVPEADLTHDRNWHWNKCEDPIINTRTYGRPVLRPWARGGAYYLGPGPLRKIVLFLTRFPGMFEGEYYEDKLVGDLLAFENVELKALDTYGDFGLRLTEQHRFMSHPL